MDTTLTEEQQRQVVKIVEEMIVARSKGGVLVSEADFFSGALAALIGVDYADMGGDSDIAKYIPFMWILWPGIGRSVVETILAREEEE